MPIAMQGSQTLGETSSGTTVAINYPAGVTSGELLLAKITTTNNNVSTSGPSGWTLAQAHQNTTAGTVSSAVWYRIAASSLSGSVTFNGASTAGRLTCTIERWSGVDTTTPFDVAATTLGSTNATSFTMPSITTVTAGAVTVYTISHNSSSGTHVASGDGLTTKIGNGPSASVGREQGIFYENRASAGATGTRMFNNGTSQWGGIVVALRPAASGLSYTGSAALTGAGTLTGSSSSMGIVRSVALTGSGTLAAVANAMSLSGSASFSGSGVLTAVGSELLPPVILPSHTDPYARDAEERIRFSAKHIHTATAYPSVGDPIELDVEDMSVEFDDSRAPRIQASLTCKIPEDQSVLDSLDSRQTFRVMIYAGYEWNSIEKDIQLLADLHVRSREVRKPENHMILECWSDEGLAMDYKRMAWDSQPPQTTLIDAVSYHVGLASTGGDVPDVRSDYTYSFGSDAVAGLEQEPGQDSWSMIYEAASRAGVSVYCESDRTWRIAKPQALSSVTALNLNAGGGGILIDSNAVTNRENFHNGVCIGYKWKDSNGDDQVVYGHAYIEAGPLAFNEIGRNTYYEEREIPVSQAQADAAAISTLISLSRRGRSFVVNSVSAYWLRPGMTVTATLPDSEQERLLVSAVYFNFPSGSMSVRLRQPEDVLISNS